MIYRTSISDAECCQFIHQITFGSQIIQWALRGWLTFGKFSGTKDGKWMKREGWDSSGRMMRFSREEPFALIWNIRGKLLFRFLCFFFLVAYSVPKFSRNVPFLFFFFFFFFWKNRAYISGDTDGVEVERLRLINKIISIFIAVDSSFVQVKFVLFRFRFLFILFFFYFSCFFFFSLFVFFIIISVIIVVIVILCCCSCVISASEKKNYFINVKRERTKKKARNKVAFIWFFFLFNNKKIFLFFSIPFPFRFCFWISPRHTNLWLYHDAIWCPVTNSAIIATLPEKRSYLGSNNDEKKQQHQNNNSNNNIDMIILSFSSNNKGYRNMRFFFFGKNFNNYVIDYLCLV